MLKSTNGYVASDTTKRLTKTMGLSQPFRPFTMTRSGLSRSLTAQTTQQSFRTHSLLPCPSTQGSSMVMCRSETLLSASNK